MPVPRNGTGVFFVLNPTQIGKLRSSPAVNANFTDMGKEITNSLPLDGTAGMEKPLKIANGNTATPGIAFGADTNTGFKRRNVDSIAWVSGGAERFYIDAQGKAFQLGSLDTAGDFSVGGKLTGKSNVGQMLGSPDVGAILRDGATLASQPQFIQSVPIYVDGLTVGGKVLCDVRIPFGCKILAYSITADAVGNATVEIWKTTFANFPPSVSDKITGISPITLAGQAARVVSTITDWSTVDVAAGDTLRFYLGSLGGGISALSVTLAVGRSFAS